MSKSLDPHELLFESAKRRVEARQALEIPPPVDAFGRNLAIEEKTFLELEKAGIDECACGTPEPTGNMSH